MHALNLERGNLIAAGFSANQVGPWLYRGEKPLPNLWASDLIALAVLLRVPADYLCGAPTRYDRYGDNYNRVVAEATFDLFLGSTPEGRSVIPGGDVFELLRCEVECEDPPKSVEVWELRYETIVRSLQRGQTRDADLRRMTEAT